MCAQLYVYMCIHMQMQMHDLYIETLVDAGQNHNKSQKKKTTLLQNNVYKV